MKQDKNLKRYASLVVSMASFITPFMGSAVNLAVPAIGQQFGSKAYLLGWVATGYILTSAAFLVPFGRLADIVGRKKVFSLGTAFFAVVSVLCALSWSIESLIAFRMLQGVAGAMIFATAVAILTSVFPPQERGKALGLNAAAVYVGLSLGPVLGGVLNHNFGWPSIFYFSAALAAILFCLTVYGLKGEWAGARGERFDFGGALMYAGGLSAFLLGISSVTGGGWAVLLLVLGLLVLALFVRFALTASQPLLNLRLFSGNTVFTFSNLAALINYCATFAVGFLLSLYLQVARGFDSQTAGFILLAQPLMMAALSPVAGAVSDRVEPRIVSSSGMALTTASLLVFCFLGRGTPLWLIVGNLFLLGIGFAFFASPNTNAVMGSVDRRFYGVASSTLGTMRLAGQAISMALVTLFLSFYLGKTELSPASAPLLVTCSRTAFIVFTVICFGGIFASLARGDLNREAERGRKAGPA